MGHVSQRENFCLDLSTPLSLGLAEGNHVLTQIHFITGLLLYNRIKLSADLLKSFRPYYIIATNFSPSII